MRLACLSGLLIAALSTACADQDEFTPQPCATSAITGDPGSAIIEVSILVPHTNWGGYHQNGGVFLYDGDCDSHMPAILADETVDLIVDSSPAETLTAKLGENRLVDATLSIETFEDQDGNPRFFVTDVLEMRPVLEARNAFEEEFFEPPVNFEQPVPPTSTE